MKTGEVWLAQLDPTVGSKIQKTRPCVVISPDDMNAHLRTVIRAIQGERFDAEAYDRERAERYRQRVGFY